VTTERFQTVLGSGILSDVFEEKATLSNRFAVRQALGLDPLPYEPIVLIVDYNQTLEQMIAAGRYDWTSSDITVKRFPIEGKGVVEFEAILFHFDKNISSGKVKCQIEEAGWQVGNIEHLLSFGANYPEEQRKYTIIGLGYPSGFIGWRYISLLDKNDSKRILSSFIYWCGFDCCNYYRFLAVRKKVSQTSVS
jgi:hypothetical protein